MQVLVVFDDLDSDFGAVKLKQKGGHGGHNGMRSIIQWFGNSHAFPRIKVGIGRPEGPIPIASYVLGRFGEDQQAELDAVIRSGVCAVESADLILHGDRE
jgi:peptidyl-tRNA hydrolase, PTH1 family